MSFFAFFRKTARHPSSRPRQARPRLEELESRVVPYAVSSSAWPNPQLITISFVPDGTNLGGAASNLFATFNAKFGSATTWEAQILKAAQLWAQQTNINFTVVPDNGSPLGSGNDEQGNPGMGDIRIGGYNFGSTTLAQAYMPPPINNYSIGGDIQFNTAQAFNINNSYDLMTVAAHEIGHALGMYHSTLSSAEMYSSYTGTKQTLSTDDVAGIRAMYSAGQPRALDAYAALGDTSFAAAASLTAQINTSTLTAVVNNLNISTAGQVEYYTVVVPKGGAGTFTVSAQSTGLSLLSPEVTVYAADQKTILGTNSTGSGWGGTASVAVSNATASEVLYIKVQGKDATDLGTGAYALTLAFGNKTAPTVTPAVVSTPNGKVLSNGGGQALKLNPEFLVNNSAGSQNDVGAGARTTAVDAQGNSIVVWESDNQDGSGWGVYAQMYNSDGSLFGGVFRVNTTTQGDQRSPSVAMDPNGDFVVVWQSFNQDGSGWGVYAQRFNFLGVAQGGEFLVNTTTLNDQTDPSVAMDANGDFVVAWQSFNPASGHGSIYARRFNAQGTPQGGEFPVSPTLPNDQVNPSAAMDANGDFVVAWQSFNQDGSGWGVYAQRFNFLGVAQGGEFLINTTTLNDQVNPSVAMDAVGDFAITWSSMNQDGSGWGVYAQTYTAQGAAQGGEFQVNTTTTGDQMDSSVAMDPSGNFVVAWQSFNQGGSGWNLFAQQYTASGAPAGGEFQVNTNMQGDHQGAAIALDGYGDAVIDWTVSGTGAGDGVYARRFLLQMQSNTPATGGKLEAAASDALPAPGSPHPLGCNCPQCVRARAAAEAALLREKSVMEILPAAPASPAADPPASPGAAPLLLGPPVLATAPAAIPAPAANGPAATVPIPLVQAPALAGFLADRGQPSLAEPLGPGPAWPGGFALASTVWPTTLFDESQMQFVGQDASSPADPPGDPNEAAVDAVFMMNPTL